MSRAVKDSGIPWIGEIPNHWETCFIKQIMRNKSVKGFPNEQVLSLYREYGVVPKDSRDDNHNITSDDTSSYKLVDAGDFVINKMKAWQGSMAVSDYRGIISPAYYICRFTAPVYKRYIHYLLRNETYKAEYLRLSTGLRIGQWDLNIEDFLHIPMVLPPIPEQQAIADFLDKKCGEIDEMISLQEKIIEELKAYKQSVITEAVCKGLNPDVPMKDSGIEWIGQIPEGWEVRRGKNLAKVFSGFPFDSNLFSLDKQYIQLIRIRDILNNESSTYYTGDYSQEAIVHRGDILVGMDGDFNVAYWGGEDGLLNQRVCKLILNQEVSPKYVYYVIQRPLKSKNDITYSTTVKHLSTDDIGVLFVPYPPYKEQQAIADYLDNKCAEIDTLISVKQSKIDTLKEYKKSIIYEFITGKKEVND